MKTMTITDFKTHALRIFNQVAEHKETILVTKRGRPIAEVIPYSNKTSSPGNLSDMLLFEKDIITPLGEHMWDASK